MSEVHITMLGKFEVAVDGRAVSAGEWGRRHATSLVKVLALTHDRRLHREQVIDAIWPDDSLEQAVRDAIAGKPEEAFEPLSSGAIEPQQLNSSIAQQPNSRQAGAR
jgi:hypothetical protein